MKKFMFVVCISAFCLMSAQEENTFEKVLYAVTKAELSIGTHVLSPIENNSWKSIYNQKLGYNLNLKITKKWVGIGVGYYENKADIKNTQLIGLFDMAKFKQWHVYGIGRYEPIQNIWLEIKAGVAFNTIVHKNQVDTYKEKSQGFVGGLAFQFAFDPQQQFRIKAGYDIILYKGKDFFDVHEQERDFFTKNTSSLPYMALVFQF